MCFVEHMWVGKYWTASRTGNFMWFVEVNVDYIFVIGLDGGNTIQEMWNTCVSWATKMFYM